jgi:putative transposase
LGICNLAALYIEGERPAVYSGRAVLSDWVYRTKKIADKQSKLPGHKHASRNISIAYRTRTRRLRHSINAMLRDIFEKLEANDVGHLAVGDLKGIREDANHGDTGNQRLHNFWAFDVTLARIYELGEEYGITITKVSERNTSKTCCLCGKMHSGRIERGLMVCKETHQSINADVNGAANIMKVAVNRPLSSVLSTLSKGASGSGLMAQPLLLRWNYYEWS